MVPSSSPSHKNRCNAAAWYYPFAYVVFILLAEVVLALRSRTFLVVRLVSADPLECCRRIHALAMGNIYITFGFAAIATSQFAIGMWVTFYHSALEQGKDSFSYWKGNSHSRRPLSIAILVPEIQSLDAFHLCGPQEQRTPEVLYAGFSLLYGA